jgi:hypothetical protein
MESSPEGGRGMTDLEIRELRARYGLDHCPKQKKRERVVVAMNGLLRTHTEEEVRAVVATSASSWQRARAWYRQERGLTPLDPLEAGPMGPDLWHPWQDALEESRRRQEEETSRERLREYRLVSGAHVGWSWLTQMARASQRELMQNVIGDDVGDPVGDMHYLRFRERQAAARAARLEAASGQEVA